VLSLVGIPADVQADRRGDQTDPFAGRPAERRPERPVQQRQQAALQRVDRGAVAGVVAAVEGDLADRVRPLLQQPDEVGEDGGGLAALPPVGEQAQRRTQDGVLHVQRPRTPHHGDEGAEQGEPPAVGLLPQHLAGRAADPAGDVVHRPGVQHVEAAGAAADPHHLPAQGLHDG
jgi:hypothetical protein